MLPAQSSSSPLISALSKPELCFASKAQRILRKASPTADEEAIFLVQEPAAALSARASYLGCGTPKSFPRSSVASKIASQEAVTMASSRKFIETNSECLVLALRVLFFASSGHSTKH